MTVFVLNGESDSLTGQKIEGMHYLYITATAAVFHRKRIAERQTRDDPVVVDRFGSERRNGNGVNE